MESKLPLWEPTCGSRRPVYWWKVKWLLEKEQILLASLGRSLRLQHPYDGLSYRDTLADLHAIQMKLDAVAWCGDMERKHLVAWVMQCESEMKEHENKANEADF